MTEKKTNKPEFDMDFEEALKRFGQTDPKELNSALEDYELARKLAKEKILSDDPIIDEIEKNLRVGTRRGRKKFSI